MSQTELLEDVLARFLEAERVGQAPDVTEWVSQHPHLATDLQSFLTDRERFRSLAATIIPAGTIRPIETAAFASPAAVGSYRILGELGRGGMGVVYKASQSGLNRLVALKMVLDGAHAGPEGLSRFKAEAEAVARLKHPNIVQIYEVASWEGRPYFSLEFVDGGNLAQRIAGEPQPARQSAALVETLAGAMDYAHHQGIVHRDLKPANVLLTAFGMPKVTDFGLAKHLEKSDGATRTGAILGTPSYMAPEQAAGKKDVGPLSDVYSLGAILYEMLTGRAPFKGETPMDTMLQVVSEPVVPPGHLNARVPRDLETICLKCLQKEPAKRYANASLLAQDLRRFLTGEPIRARPAGVVERLTRWCRRKPLAASLIAAVFVVGLIGFAGVTMQWLRAEHNLDDARREYQRAEKNLAEANRLRGEAEKDRAEARQERDRAEKNFEDARTAVDQFFTRVSEERLLNTPGLQGLRKELLDMAQQYYQGFLKQHAGDPALKAAAADAHYRLGLIQSIIGTRAEALASFEKAQQLGVELVASKPSDPKARRALSKINIARARTQMEMGRLREAMGAYQAAQSLLNQLRQEEPNNLDYQDDLIYIQDGFAGLLKRNGQLGEALQAYQGGREHLEKLIAADPTPKRRFRLAIFTKNIAAILGEDNQAGKSRELYETALGLLKTLCEQYPQDLNYARDWAACAMDLSSLALADGKADEALDWGRKARAVIERLARDNSRVTQFRADLAHCLTVLGRAHHQLKQSEPAITLLNQARDLGIKAMAEQPDALLYRESLGMTYLSLAQVLRESGHLADARKSADQALDLFDRLSTEQPGNLAYRAYRKQADTEAKKILQALNP